MFHGEGRAKSPDLLVECDILLTTYHTLAADWKGRKVLQKINWFRVILDEGELLQSTIMVGVIPWLTYKLLGETNPNFQ